MIIEMLDGTIEGINEYNVSSDKLELAMEQDLVSAEWEKIFTTEPGRLNTLIVRNEKGGTELARIPGFTVFIETRCAVGSQRVILGKETQSQVARINRLEEVAKEQNDYLKKNQQKTEETFVEFANGVEQLATKINQADADTDHRADETEATMDLLLTTIIPSLVV